MSIPNINKNDSIDSLLCYHEDNIKACCIKLKNDLKNSESKDVIYANLNTIFNNMINDKNTFYKIGTKEMLVNILNNFFKINIEFNEYKYFILDFIYNSFNFKTSEKEQVVDKKLIKFQKEFGFFKNNILNNKKINKNFVALYCNGYWSNYAFENKISKQDLLSMTKKLVESSILSVTDLTLLENSLKFYTISSKEEVNEYEENLVEFLSIYSVKKYIDNWKNIKINQINNSSLQQNIKIQYFQQLEDDYVALVTVYDKSLEDIKDVLKIINSREYMKKFCIDFSVTKNFSSILDSQNVGISNMSNENTIEKELDNIKKYQNLMSSPNNYYEYSKKIA